jgi:NAD-dependent deacetylase
VWFGEALPPRVWQEAQQICAALDCLLVVGTSATVYPAAGLIEQAAANGSTIISINTEPSGSAAGRLELVGRASVLLPQLLDDLALATRP